MKHLPFHQSGSLKSFVWVSAFPIPPGAPWRQRQGLNSVGVSPAPGQSLAQRCTPIPDKCSHAHPPQPPPPGWGQRGWWDGPQKPMATLHPTPASHGSLQHPAALSFKRPQLSACQLSPQCRHAGAPRPPEPALLSCGINAHGGKSLHSDQLPRQEVRLPKASPKRWLMGRSGSCASHYAQSCNETIFALQFCAGHKSGKYPSLPREQAMNIEAALGH